MDLEGQDARRNPAERGYAMAALLVSVAVMGVLMSIAMPVWHQQIQREKEAELVFRGEQYARAIALYMRKFPGAFPPNVDILVQQKFLRKKYKDPMTEDGEFQILYAGAQPQGAQQGGAAGARTVGSGSGAGQASGGRSGSTGGGTGPAGAMGQGGSSGQAGGLRGGMIGVASKSTEASVMLYKGRSHYNEWQFVYNPMTTQPGGGVPGAAPGAGPGRPMINPQTGQPMMPGTMPPGGRGRGQGPPNQPPTGRGGAAGTPRPPGRPPG